MPITRSGFGRSPKTKFIPIDETEDAAADGADQQRPDQRIKAHKVEITPIERLIPNPRNAKKHPPKQIALLCESIERFGVNQPLVIDRNYKIHCGHARYEAARKIGLAHVPVIKREDLTDAELKALAIADNKLSELSEWDMENLAEQFQALCDEEVELDARMLGFDTAEIDQILAPTRKSERADPADQCEAINPDSEAVTTRGDLWAAGEHLLLCADATYPQSYEDLLGTDVAEMAFVDFSRDALNHTRWANRVREQEATVDGGTPSPQQAEFFSVVSSNVSRRIVDAAVAYFCIDWRRFAELWTATTGVFWQPKDTIALVKSRAGRGTFYRSQHELVLVCAAPGKPVKNASSGFNGRHRTNVWECSCSNSLTRGRDKVPKAVKPIAMVMDAIKDCSNRGGIVLDPFGGYGTTMIAAERTHRRARLLEIDPLHCDAIIERWQGHTGKIARLVETKESFAEVKARHDVWPLTKRRQA